MFSARYYINKIFKTTGKELKLKESWTAYRKYGKGPKKKLRFSKSNNEKIEKAYATHYIAREEEK